MIYNHALIVKVTSLSANNVDTTYTWRFWLCCQNFDVTNLIAYILRLSASSSSDYACVLRVWVTLSWQMKNNRKQNLRWLQHGCTNNCTSGPTEGERSPNIGEKIDCICVGPNLCWTSLSLWVSNTGVWTKDILVWLWHWTLQLYVDMWV